MGASLTELIGSFGLHLRAMNRRPKTVVSYTEAVNGLAAFLHGAGVSTEVNKLRKRDNRGVTWSWSLRLRRGRGGKLATLGCLSVRLVFDVFAGG
jgi:hypothetical protein